MRSNEIAYLGAKLRLRQHAGGMLIDDQAQLISECETVGRYLIAHVPGDVDKPALQPPQRSVIAEVILHQHLKLRVHARR